MFALPAKALICSLHKQAMIGREELALPWRHSGLEVVRYGGVMLQLKSDQGYVLTFTPQSNEFTITLLSSETSGHTAGLCGNRTGEPFAHSFMQTIGSEKCVFLSLLVLAVLLLSCVVYTFLTGACGEAKVNVLSFRNGSTTTDQPAFISDWTVAGDGGVCLPKRKAVCVSGVAMGCQALRSEVFEKCHAYIAVQVFLIKCEEQACDESDVCEIISAYAHLCKQSGVCVDWRSPHLCRKSLCITLSLLQTS